jgi:hypothetical protein
MNSRRGADPVYAASVLSASIVAIGLYLAIASTIGMTAAWIGIGILGIAVVASVSLVTTGRRPSSA